MKKLIYLLVILVMPILAFANNVDNNGDEDRKKKKKKTEIRAERNVAITLDGGWNTVGANGVLVSYYATPRIGIDAGVGIGIKGPKLGIRGKYMLSDNNFAPFVGLGVSGRFWSEEDVLSTNETDFDVESLTYDINNVLYAQLSLGFEFISNGGFVIGLATGYTIATNDPITVKSGDSNDIETGLDLLWGNGIIMSFNIGYAF